MILLGAVWAVLGVTSALVLPEELHPEAVRPLMPLTLVVFWACFDNLKRSRYPRRYFLCAWGLTYCWPSPTIGL